MWVLRCTFHRVLLLAVLQRRRGEHAITPLSWGGGALLALVCDFGLYTRGEFSQNEQVHTVPRRSAVRGVVCGVVCSPPCSTSSVWQAAPPPQCAAATS